MSVTVQDAPDYTGLANVTIVGQIEALEVTGSITVSSGNVEITGPLTDAGNIPVAIQESIQLDVNITNSVVNITGDVTVSSGSVDISGPLSDNGNVNVAIQESVQIDVNVTNSTLNISGDVTVSSGSVDISGPLTSDGYVAVEITKSITIDVNVTNSTLNISGDVTVSSGSVDISGPLTTEGNVSVAIQQSITIDVNVTNSVINIQGDVNANITNPTLTIQGDVNVTNSVLNVSVTNSVLPASREGYVLHFEAGQYVDFSDSPDFGNISGSNPHTIVVWLRFDDLTSHKAIIFFGEPSTNQLRYMAYHNTSKQIRVGYYGNDWDTGYTPPAKTWICLAWVYTGSEDKFYVNGEFYSSRSVSGVGTPSPPWTEHYIGYYSTAGWKYAGDMAQIMVFDDILSDEEIAKLYQFPDNPPTSHLVLWYRFDAGSGTTAEDLSIKGNDGTIVDATWSRVEYPPTALFNVNVVASQITMNVNVTNSVLNIQGNVEITNAELNIRITAQDVNVKIITPSGIPAYVGSSFINKIESGVVWVTAGSESGDLLSVSGRGRLKTIAFYYRTSNPDSDAVRYDMLDSEIRIYVDGATTPTVQISLRELDMLNGHQIWGQAIDSGLGNYTAPIGPRGGLGFAQRADYVSVGGFGATRVCGVYVCEVEFTTGVVVRWYNADSVDLAVRAIFEYGNYPGGE